MDIKPNFDKAEKLARELRLMQPTNDFSLNINTLDFDREIYIDTFENYAARTNCSVSDLTSNGKMKDGYTVKSGMSSVILYHDVNKYEPRLKWTIAHEIGHIYMGHKKDNGNEEVEAHWFAAEFLTPIPIIFEILKKGVKVSTTTLSELFGISPEAAIKRVNSLNRMPVKSAYLTSDFHDKYGAEIDAYVNDQKRDSVFKTY